MTARRFLPAALLSSTALNVLLIVLYASTQRELDQARVRAWQSTLQAEELIHDQDKLLQLYKAKCSEYEQAVSAKKWD